MRTLLATVCLTLIASAGENDGASADARRWAHPRGPASRSRVSHAQAPDSLGKPAWTLKAPSELKSAPLTWDGIGYLMFGDVLVAIDLDNGRRVASHKVSGGGASTLQRAALGNGSVFLRVDSRLQQFRRSEKTFKSQWSVNVGARASAPCVYQGEVYLTANGKTVRYRPGRKQPAWEEGEGAFGTPALFGEHVYSLEASGDKASVVARARLDGREALRVEIGEAAKDGLVAVGALHVCVRVGKRWVLLKRVSKDGKLSVSRPWDVPYTEGPLLYSRSVIGFAKTKGTYMLYRYLKDKKNEFPLVNANTRADLILGAGSPIALGEQFCTGLWCAKINSNRITWHLHERSRRPLLKQGIAFHPVPAGDTKLLLVARDKKSIVCIQPEVIGG